MIVALLDENEVLLTKYARVNLENGYIRTKFEKHACFVEDDQNFPELAQQKAGRIKNALFVDLASSLAVEKWQVVRDLEQHLFNNIVFYNGRYYRQHTGIPQGSILSSLLCSLFYADFERRCLSSFIKPLPNAGLPQFSFAKFDDADAENVEEIEKEGNTTEPGKRQKTESGKAGANSTSELKHKPPHVEPRAAPLRRSQSLQERDISCLLRFIDDYLYVSSSQPSVQRFVSTMHIGFPNFGCVANSSKTKMNFNFEQNKGTRMIPWCGFLIDSRTLELRSDYSRYEHHCKCNESLS